MSTNLIIYDGECGFCNKTMIFFAKNDSYNHFMFVSNTSKIGVEILSQNHLGQVSKNSIVVIGYANKKWRLS